MDHDDAFALIDKVEREESYLWKLLQRLLRHFRYNHHRAQIAITFPGGSTVRGDNMDITVAPDSANKYPLTFTIVDTFGIPVAGDPGTVTWTAPDPAIATLDSLTGATVNLLTVAEGTSSTAITATNGTFSVSVNLTVGGPGAGVGSAATIVVGAPVPR